MNSAHLEEVLELIVDNITDAINSNFSVAQQLANGSSNNPFVHACATIVNANTSMSQLDKLQVSAAAMSDIFGLVYPVMLADGNVDAAELEVLRKLLQESLYRYTWIGDYRRLPGLNQASGLALLLAEWSRDTSPLGGNLTAGSLFTPCLALAVLAREITNDEEALLTYCQGLHLVIHMVAEALGWNEQERVVVKKLEATLAQAREAVFTGEDETAVQVATDDSRDEVLGEASRELGNLIGLTEVKFEISRLIRKLSGQGEKSPNSTAPLNLLFIGNSGIGKSKVAKLLGKILYGIGVLESSRVIAWDSAKPAHSELENAIGGVLCVELPSPSTEALAKLWESILTNESCMQRKIAVVLSGTAEEIDEALQLYEGASDCFRERLYFQDLHVAELFQVFERFCESNGYLLTSNVRGNLAILLNRAYTTRGSDFANVHFVRQLFDLAIQAHAERLSKLEGTVTKIMLATFDESDLPFGLVQDCAGPYDLSSSRWRSVCPNCDKAIDSSVKMLGRTIDCDCGESYRCPSWNLTPETVPKLESFQVYEGPQDLIGLALD